MIEPILRTKTVEYWGCPIESHCHTTKEIAARCIHKQTHKRPPIDRFKIYSRKIRIAREVINGKTLKEVAEEESRSVTVISQHFRWAIFRGSFLVRLETSDLHLRQIRKKPKFWLEVMKNLETQLKKQEMKKKGAE